MNKKNILISLFSFVVLSFGVFFYFVFFQINIYSCDKRLNLGEETSYELFLKKLQKEEIVSNLSSLKIAMQVFRWRNRGVKQGSYKINKDFSNFEFLNKITRGEQDPLKITVRHYETKEELAEYLGRHLMFDEKDFLQLLNNEEFLKKYNVNKNNVLTLFIANTYQVYWNISLQKFFDRIDKEFKNFWTKEKSEKAQNLKLTPNEVIILASIVEKEIVRQEEASVIAGVFINRLAKKMRLQSDPTTFYARKYDSQKNDVSSCMRGAKSGYNTYRFAGLPIGPICIPSLRTIDAVLNYEKHDFLFFVTAPDRTHHLLTQTFQNHRKNINYTFKKHKISK
ncbi:MAG: endolytic transglycosylase MltG [Cytophagales bacterium]|jgi:UPF0755 protein|nr:endolytic transglycosylase MltG [Cytophagales bacterium]